MEKSTPPIPSSSTKIKAVPEQKEYKDTKFFHRTRYFLTALAFLGVICAFAMRVTLSIAIVAMTNSKVNPSVDHLEWTLKQQTLTLSAFFWGYAMASLPSGLVLQRYGARFLFFISNLMCGILTLFIPFVSRSGGYIALAVVRVFQGAAQAPIFPSVNALFGKWSPPAERATLVSIVYSGMQAGNIIVFSSSGLIARSINGWPAIFYIFACIAICWCIIWITCSADTPDEHWFINKVEKEFIMSFYMGQQAQRSFKAPWKSILTSIPVWTVIVSYSVQYWGFYMILTMMPTYLSNVMEFHIETNGLMSSLPYIVMLITIFLFASLADLVGRKKILSLSWSRKVFSAIGFLGPMLAMISLTFMTKDKRIWAVILLMASSGLNAGVYVGFQVNFVDLAPNFAGLLMGFCNSFANIISLAVPLTVGVIVVDKESHIHWGYVFYITAALYLFGTIVYLILGTSEKQSWNEPNSPMVEKP